MESPNIAADGTINLHRPIKGQSYLIRVQKDGLCPKYWLTVPKGNPVSNLNLLIGGMIGIAIDNASGACCSFSETEFDFNIQDMKQCSY
ncbi:MAG: hypothetical protein WCH01_09055 [Methylococcaceae bacterium]